MLTVDYSTVNHIDIYVLKTRMLTCPARDVVLSLSNLELKQADLLDL